MSIKSLLRYGTIWEDEIAPVTMMMPVPKEEPYMTLTKDQCCEIIMRIVKGEAVHYNSPDGVVKGFMYLLGKKYVKESDD